MQAPFSPDTVFRQSNRISSGSTIRKDGSLHRKSGSHRWQSAVADRYSQPARRYSCFGRVVQLDRADGTNSPLFTTVAYHIDSIQRISADLLFPSDIYDYTIRTYVRQSLILFFINKLIIMLPIIQPSPL